MDIYEREVANFRFGHKTFMSIMNKNLNKIKSILKIEIVELFLIARKIVFHRTGEATERELSP